MVYSYIGLALMLYGFTRFVMKKEGNVINPLLLGITGVVMAVDPVYGVTGIVTLVIIILGFSIPMRYIYTNTITNMGDEE